MKDEYGYQAVFSEQGTSASHMAAAKFLDAIARFQGNDGEDSDAIADKCSTYIAKQGYGFFAVELKSTSEFIGIIGLHSPQDLPCSPCVEIGWRLDKKFWRQGYATEGALAVLNYGFEVLNCREIVSFTSSINLASIAVMKRIGMQYVVDGDFDHPTLERGHKLCRHVLYRISTP